MLDPGLGKIVDNDSVMIGDFKIQTDKLKDIINNNAEITDKLKDDLLETVKKLIKPRKFQT